MPAVPFTRRVLLRLTIYKEQHNNEQRTKWHRCSLRLSLTTTSVVGVSAAVGVLTSTPASPSWHVPGLLLDDLVAHSMKSLEGSSER